MKNYFEESFEHVLLMEGGYSDHPYDTGGKTKYGITEKIARKHGYVGDMKMLSVDMAKEIYRRDYWTSQGLDEVSKVSPRIALEMFDTGVNMGISSSSFFLQRSLNSFPLKRGQKTLRVDAKVGRKTVLRLSYLCNQGYEESILKLMNCMQGMKYYNIAQRKSSQKVFMKGWLKRVKI